MSFGFNTTRLVPPDVAAMPSAGERQLIDRMAQQAAHDAVMGTHPEAVVANARVVVRPSGSSTLVAGLVLDRWTGTDAIWDGRLAFVPRNKVAGSPMGDSIASILTSAVFENPSLWGVRTALAKDAPLETFFHSATRAWLVPRPNGTIVAAQVPGAWVKRDEIWEGAFVALPTSIREPPELRGQSLDHVLTSRAFRG